MVINCSIYVLLVLQSSVVKLNDSGSIYLGTSPKTVTPKRTPSVPTTLSLKVETIAEMKFLTLEKLDCPTLHDSSTRNTMSACTTVLHAEERRTDELVQLYAMHEPFIIKLRWKKSKRNLTQS